MALRASSGYSQVEDPSKEQITASIRALSPLATPQARHEAPSELTTPISVPLPSPPLTQPQSIWDDCFLVSVNNSTPPAEISTSPHSASESPGVIFVSPSSESKLAKDEPKQSPSSSPELVFVFPSVPDIAVTSSGNNKRQRSVSPEVVFMSPPHKNTTGGIRSNRLLAENRSLLKQIDKYKARLNEEEGKVKCMGIEVVRERLHLRQRDLWNQEKIARLLKQNRKLAQENADLDALNKLLEGTSAQRIAALENKLKIFSQDQHDILIDIGAETQKYIESIEVDYNSRILILETQKTLDGTEIFRKEQEIRELRRELEEMHDARVLEWPE